MINPFYKFKFFIPAPARKESILSESAGMKRLFFQVASLSPNFKSVTVFFQVHDDWPRGPGPAGRALCHGVTAEVAPGS